MYTCTLIPGDGVSTKHNDSNKNKAFNAHMEMYKYTYKFIFLGWPRFNGKCKRSFEGKSFLSKYVFDLA